MTDIVKRRELSQLRGRRRRSPSRRRSWLPALFALLLLAAAAIALYTAGGSFPLETLLAAAIVAACVIAVFLYVGELVVVGWIVDFFSWLTTPILHVKQTPLVCQQVGEMVVVKLSDNIVTARQCQTVQKQLNRLVDEHHCDFVLDFACVGKVSIRFRGVMVQLARGARREAGKLGKPYRPVALPPGDVFRVFADRESAVAEMGKHEGHGWVVLCSVPAGIRAVPEAF
jgi:hypothetical protein